MKPWAGVIGEDGVEIQRMYLVSIATGQGRFGTPPSLHVYEFAFSPVGEVGAFIAAAPPGENNWWVAKLYTTTRTDPTPKVVFDPNTTTSALHGLQIAVPRFSPDGKQIAFIGGLMSDQGSTGGDVWVINAKGGEPTDVTPGINGSPTYIAWTGPDTIGFVEDRSGHTLLADYTVSTQTQDGADDLGETSVGGGPIKNALGFSNNGVPSRSSSPATHSPRRSTSAASRRSSSTPT